MSTYLTEVEFLNYFDEDEITQLTNLDKPTATVPDSTKLQAAIERASDEIDSLLMGGWTLPLTSVPTILKIWCADIIRYFLDYNNPRENVYLRYKAAIKAVREVAEKKRDIGLDENDDAVPSKNQIGIFSTQEVFNDRDLSGFTF